MASPRRRLFTLIFYTSNRQGIDWMCESALEKRLGTTFRLMEWDQASASWRTVGGRATPAARRARLAARRRSSDAGGKGGALSVGSAEPRHDPSDADPHEP